MKKARFPFLNRQKNKPPNAKSDTPINPEKSVDHIAYASLSDIGLRRSTNQDSFGVFPEDSQAVFSPKGQLFIIADGIGGHIGGNTASKMAVNIIQEEYFKNDSEDISDSLLKAFQKANKLICDELSCSDPYLKMGTTCSALVLTSQHGCIAHVGDSEIFQIENEKILKLTLDHTIIVELMNRGAITEDEAKKHPEKSVLSRALGIEAEVEIDILENIVLQGKQSFVLCTDGLAKVSPEEIKNVVLGEQPKEACRILVQMANDRGGGDNVTVQVIKIQSLKV
jgi:serine/threonine protein phosphatase PrpC